MADEGTTATAEEAAGSQEQAGSTEPDWKAESRKHESRAKAERKAREALEAKLEEQAAAGQSEQEKAIAKARKEAREEALSEAEKDRRKDRLDVAVTRLAARTFADTEDALLHIERAISNGDVDAEEIFSAEGKVQQASLKTALEDLLKRKPHLGLAGSTRPSGDADAGKGNGGSQASGMENFIRSNIKRT